MSQDQWSAVDRFITGHLVPADPALDEALAQSAAAGLPAIHVAPNQGKLLHLLARIHGARSILEIGTLGGYSTIWLARALPRTAGWSPSRLTRRTRRSLGPTSPASGCRLWSICASAGPSTRSRS